MARGAGIVPATQRFSPRAWVPTPLRRVQAPIHVRVLLTSLWMERGWNVGRGARRPVSRVLSAALASDGTTIPLGRALRRASRDQPGRRVGNAPASRLAVAGPAPAGRPYSVLLPVGFALPPPSPGARCALTAPFHPCRRIPWSPTRRAGGLFSVALSLGSPPPAVSRHRISVEPGLSSSDDHGPPPAVVRPSGAAEMRPGPAGVNRSRPAAALFRRIPTLQS